MNSSTEKNGSLVFMRALLGGRILVRTECPPGSITVLQDENGADLPSYESFFYEKASKERIQIEFNLKPIDLAEVIRIGFTDTIPAGISIQDYLSAAGYSAEELESLMQTYELDKVSYLPCAHLPIGPQRIVLLLSALKSSRPALVLRDPFMPFSGRWREHFAKLLLEDSRERSRVIICTNLSFVPQTWSQGNLMNYLDVGHAAEAMRAQYRWEQESKARELKAREHQEKSAKKVEITPQSTPLTAADAVEKTVTPPAGTEGESIPTYYLNSVYREARDRIFTPLKEFSEFMRSYSAIVIVGSMAVLLATMGIAFSPDLSKYQEKMRSLATDPKSIFAAVLSAPAENPVPLNSSEPPADTEPTHEDTQVTNESLLLNPEYETLIPTGVDELLASGETPLLDYFAASSLINGNDENQNSCNPPLTSAPGTPGEISPAD